jgi:GTP-binding protein HflX
MRDKYPHAVSISARTGEGIEPLLAELGTQLRPIREFLDLRVPQTDAAVIARLYAVGQVVESRYSGKTARLKVRIPPHLHDEFAGYRVEEE